MMFVQLPLQIQPPIHISFFFLHIFSNHIYIVPLVFIQPLVQRRWFQSQVLPSNSVRNLPAPDQKPAEEDLLNIFLSTS